MEVEGIVRQHEEVADVAAYGITSKELAAEDEWKIDTVRIPNSTLTFAELVHCINHKAPCYFVPGYMDFVKELPDTPTNKVQKFILKKSRVTDQTWDLKKSHDRIKRP